jgi:hypothetical protein
MKRISFDIPTTAGHEPRQGYRIWLTIEGAKHAFVLQLDDRETPGILADWASGYRLCDLRPRMLRNYVGHPAAYDSSLNEWRREAQRFLNETIRTVGLEELRAKLAAAPTINGVK